MKKLTIFITLLLFFITSFGQQSTGTTAPKPNTDYLSKKQKTKNSRLGNAWRRRRIGSYWCYNSAR